MTPPAPLKYPTFIEARSFVPVARTRPRPDPPSLALWRHVADPFVLPPSIHRCRPCDWELVDCDAAGCRLCGRGHLCAVDTCPTVAYEGRQVCEITGFCVRNHQYGQDEFVDTVAHIPAPHPPAVRVFEWGQVDGWVRDVLCSDRTRASLEAESRKRVHRVHAIFVRLIKHWKAQRAPINLIHLCTLIARAVANVRTPRLDDPHRLDALAASCVDAIARFCSTFFDPPRCAPPAVKMQGFVVGLLYLMRGGMCIGGNIEIVPRVTGLAAVLPTENQVKALFRLSTKIMTEVENVIKMTLRHHTREQLVGMGFGQY